jgi:hypothetical protein
LNPHVHETKRQRPFLVLCWGNEQEFIEMETLAQKAQLAFRAINESCFDAGGHRQDCLRQETSERYIT